MSGVSVLGALLAAPVVGSFLGVLVRRLPAGRPVGIARSACESCGHTLGARDLVPLLSYVALRGRCRFCHTRIAPAHPAIEVASLGVAVCVIAVDGADPLRMWAGCGLGWMLLALAWVDWTHLRLPDVLTLPLLLGGLAATWALDRAAVGEHAVAAACGYATFRLIGLIYTWRRGREGLGQGDAKLLGAAGAWLGLAALPGVMLGAALCGLAFLGARYLNGARDGASSAVPFGPCLAAAIWVSWLT